MTNNVFVED